MEINNTDQLIKSYYEWLCSNGFVLHDERGYQICFNDDPSPLKDQAKTMIKTIADVYCMTYGNHYIYGDTTIGQNLDFNQMTSLLFDLYSRYGFQKGESRKSLEKFFLDMK